MKRTWTSLNGRIVKCELCPRLRAHCLDVAEKKRRAFKDWEYWGRPVPNFGDRSARLLIVGLAPAAHGANRTGRMFTGDRSGDWLFRALFRAGLANQENCHDPNDGLKLIDCAITAVCHCAPPANKPARDELAACQPWLTATIDVVRPVVLLALGQIAWQGLLPELYARQWYSGRRPKFGHAVQVPLADGRWLLGSYHPSQQNTFTGRLTEGMLDDVFRSAQRLVGAGRNGPPGGKKRSAGG